MEGLMEFLEQYWGLSIMGGVSLGTIVTFVIVQINLLRKDKKKNVVVDSLLKDATKLVDTINATNKENAALQEENNLMRQTQAVTFKAISYLVVASKLPNEEKIALQKDFNDLATVSKQVAANTVKKVVVDAKATATDFVEEHTPEVTDVLKGAVNTASTLLKKYTGGV